jgi:hypothetical protein
MEITKCNNIWERGGVEGNCMKESQSPSNDQSIIEMTQNIYLLLSKDPLWIDMWWMILIHMHPKNFHKNRWTKNWEI